MLSAIQPSDPLIAVEISHLCLTCDMCTFCYNHNYMDMNRLLPNIGSHRQYGPDGLVCSLRLAPCVVGSSHDVLSYSSYRR